MSDTSFRLNLHSTVCLNVKELLARSRRHIGNLSGSHGIRTHNRLVRKRTLNHLAKTTILAKWLSVRLQTKWVWVCIPLLSHKSCRFVGPYCHICFIYYQRAFDLHLFLPGGFHLMEGGWKFSKSCWPTKKTLGYGTSKSVSFGPLSIRNTYSNLSFLAAVLFSLP